MDYNYNGYDRGYTEPAMTSADYMNRTYRWMAVGLLITFAAAFVTAATPLLYVVNSLYLVFTIAELVLVYVLSSRVQNMSVGGARATFFAYALLNGMVLSYYFLVFDLGTLVLAFLATSLYFGLMAVYGTTTHKDLSGWGPKLMMGLFALIITGFVGMLFGMSFLTTVLYSAVGLVVFMLLPQIELRLASIEGEQHIYLKEEDVSTAIRTEAAGMAASAVGANPAVRAFLLELQRDMAKKQDVLMDGRDIGTVVLPDATVKIFLTATPEARATRRWKEYQAKGIDTPYEEVLADVKQRDYQDTHRAAAPLKRADDAVLLDTSELDFEQSLAAMKKIIAEKVNQTIK